MDDFERASSGVRLADGEIQGLPVESFITATSVALAEMANIEVAVQKVYPATLDDTWSGITAVLRIKSATDGLLVLSLPERTAWAIAERVLAEVKEQINETLVWDCVGEIANVIAGQAKTLLAGTPHQLTFSLPQVVAGKLSESGVERGRGRVVIAFRSGLGEFTLQLSLQR